MTYREPLTVAQRENIYRAKLNGQSLTDLARQQHCSYSCVRKWWRTGRDQGAAGLHRSGRSHAGQRVLSTFEPLIAVRTLEWKYLHPKRGATRILQDLAEDPVAAGYRLPKPSTLAAYFHRACPELLQPHKKQPAAPVRAQRVHEVWQLDAKEQIHLQDGTIATVLDIREPVGCVFLGSHAHAVQTTKSWRRLTQREIQADLRLVFTEFGLPEGLQTDREAVYGQPAAEGFPSVFTLGLVGLGLRHLFSRPNQPTDQPQVERGHRTLFDWMAQPEPAADLRTFQADLDQARHLHNAVLPSHAGDCQGRIPLQVHPEVLSPLRPYHPAAELELFDLARVDRFLSQFTWQYKATSVGQVSIQGYDYGLGSAQAGKTVDVRFDAPNRCLVFLDAEAGQELRRRPVQGLDIKMITGLEMPPAAPTQPLQLSFAWCAVGVRLALDS